jgi:hypothetical protein
MLAALARGYGELDWAVFAHLAAEDAGEPELPAPA